MWAVSSDGLIEYGPLTKDKLHETLELLHSNFFTSESVSKYVGLSNDPTAITDLNELILRAAEDGVSLIAVDKASGRIVGCLINKIYVKEDESNNFFEEAKCNSPSARAYLELNTEIDKVADYFNLLETDCYLELMFVTVSLEFRHRDIAGKITRLAMDIPRHLQNGRSVKISLDGKALPLNPVPTTVIAVSTSAGSMNILSRLGFTKILEIDFSKKQPWLNVPVCDAPLISVMQFTNSLK